MRLTSVTTSLWARHQGTHAPWRLHSMTSELLAAFSAAIGRARVDKNVRVVIIASKVIITKFVPQMPVQYCGLCTNAQGANFCAGADFKGHLGKMYSAAAEEPKASGVFAVGWRGCCVR